MGAVVTTPAADRGLRAVIGPYVALMKPRIIELLLITTVPAMVLAARGWPGTWLVVATLIGGTLSAGGANALNNYHDRDIDQVMRRTSRRPLPNNRIEPIRARNFGWALGVAGFLVLWLTSNLLAAVISTGALLFYVYVYTLRLKRTTSQNIVIGGAAGAAPVLVGWAAVTGDLSTPAWAMFAVVFAWTPPHFWALAVRYRDDYAAAGVPMLPVVTSIESTTRQMALYSGVTVLFSLALVPLADLGWLYMITAVVTGALLMLESVRVMFKPERAMKLFTYSTAYLTILFAALLVDAL
ncbi:MAG TPA: heme o synthase [Acidimicrobiia bacterium]|nr:heme o synthase [Acidimicrobiia bacterium]